MEMDVQNLSHWLPIARGLIPTVFGSSERFVRLGWVPDRQAAQATHDAHRAELDHLLVTLATCVGEHAVEAIGLQLSDTMLTALALRWTHCLLLWEQELQQPNPHLWSPPTDCWRAIFLAATTEGIWSSESAALLWPEQFAAPSR